MEEMEFLNQVAETYNYKETEIYKWHVDSYMEIYKKYIRDEQSALELGCYNGTSVKRLSQLVKNLDVMDGSSRVINEAKKKINGQYKNVKFILSLFEDMDALQKYDIIFCSYVLEHVKNPEIILEKCWKALKQNGIMLITVPNAKALSRQMALSMGLIDDLYALT